MDPRGFDEVEEGLLFLKELGSTGNYFRGAGEQVHISWGFREPCQKGKTIN